MLNPFPIQFLALFAYTILRVCVGCIYLYLARKHLAYRENITEVLPMKVPLITWSIIFFELTLGTLFLFGLHTQYAALLSFFFALKLFILLPWLKLPQFPPRIFFFLLAGASLSLFITGAGFFAIDLPL